MGCLRVKVGSVVGNLRTVKVVRWVNVSESSGTGLLGFVPDSEDGTLG